MNQLATREQVAQLFMVGFSGKSDGDHLGSLIEKHRFTSFILFKRNAADAGSLAAMISEARARASSLGLPTLLFAADEEGGLISPLGSLVGRLPSAMALAAGGSPDRARRSASLVGTGLKGMGLDLVLAPVLDVNSRPENPVIGTRSFGDDPGLVAEMGAAVIAGFRSAGLACCAKHFPGHGGTSEDSHKTLPVLRTPFVTLEARDLTPFKRAFALGVEAAMTAHVAYPEIDDGLTRPATISGRIQTDLLRGKMGFHGALLSDSVEMKGLANALAAEDACVEALRAGVDLFVCVDPDLALRCVRHLERALDGGGIASEAVNRALSNVAYLKKRSSELARAAGTEWRESPMRSALQAVLDECYAASITLVGCKAGDLKRLLDGVKRGLFVLPNGLPGYGETDVRVLERSLSAHGYGGRWRALQYPFDPTEEEINHVVSEAGSVDGIVVCTLSRGPEPPGQLGLAGALLETGRTRVGVALLDPYGLARAFPGDLPGIASYGFWPECLKALAGAIFGPSPAGGSLPIDIKRAGC